MTPMMHERVRDLFVDAGLCDGFVVQTLYWKDAGKKLDKFIVFRPNGGTAIRDDLSSEYHILVDVVGAVDNNKDVDVAVNNIVEYVQKWPLPNDCVGFIENMGSIPAPVLTSEGRLVYRLQFAVTFGE
ncbi:hypothetical protein EH228_04395 [Erwinia endophytica]|uniref:phage tail termination protein n=1 Tax=Erwinia endophytica TaxID=1563158 RepID=UPI001265DB32|nr:hypothetical protein [Erwinia endophytica]KAB8312925.1 hypothetical protein EH228_04395 [Erwinia endophytica]